MRTTIEELMLASSDPVATNSFTLPPHVCNCTSFVPCSHHSIPKHPVHHIHLNTRRSTFRYLLHSVPMCAQYLECPFFLLFSCQWKYYAAQQECLEVASSADGALAASISSLFHGVSKLEFMVAENVRSKQTETHRQDRGPEGMQGFLQAQRHDWQAPPMTSHGMLLWLSPAILDLL